MSLMLFVTVASLATAVVMAWIAWRVKRDDRMRSEARVAALAEEIHHRPSDNPAADVLLNEPPHVAVDRLFDAAAADDAGRRPRIGAVLGAGALVVGTIGVLIVLVSGSARSNGSHAGPATTTMADAATAQDGASAPTAASMARAAAAGPLELVALGHERDKDTLTVRGVVRNPSTGAAVTHLTAVVLLFDQQGGFLTSGRATVDPAALEPGAEAPFVVTVPGAADVGRYRVSFRTDDRVVPHVDRRTRTSERGDS